MGKRLAEMDGSHAPPYRAIQPFSEFYHGCAHIGADAVPGSSPVFGSAGDRFPGFKLLGRLDRAVDLWGSDAYRDPGQDVSWLDSIVSGS